MPSSVINAIKEMIKVIKVIKEIEENNRMGKTRDLFNKIQDIKGTFHAKMLSIGQKW